MIKINEENSISVMQAAQEIIETTGQLWVIINNESIYIPELIEQLKSYHKSDD